MTKATKRVTYGWGEDTLVYMAKRLLHLSADAVFESWATQDDPRGYVEVQCPTDAVHMVHVGDHSIEFSHLTAFCTHITFLLPDLFLVTVEPMEKSLSLSLYDLETDVLYRSVSFEPEAEIIPFLSEVSAERRKEKSV